MTKTIAVVGLGNIAQRHRLNLKGLFPQARLIAVPSRQREVNNEIECADLVLVDINDLIEMKPDFVIIASPSSFHLIHALPLVKAGIPLLIEKPVTSEYRDANELLYLAEKYNTPVAVGYCLRYLPSAIAMKALLTEKKIGSIYNVFINIGQFLPDWRPTVDYQQSVSASKKLGGGVLLELSHELDYAKWLLGELDIEHVILRGSTELDIDVEAFADISLSNKNGTICHIHLDFLQKQCQRNCSIIGSEGRLDWDLLSNTISLHRTKGTDVVYSDLGWDKNKMYLAMIEDFVAFIGKKQNHAITLKDAVSTVHLIDEIKSQANWRESV